MKKLILAVAVSTFLIACGGSEHGPLLNLGGGNGGSKPEGPGHTGENGVVTDPTPDGQMGPITLDALKDAKNGGTVKRQLKYSAPKLDDQGNQEKDADGNPLYEEKVLDYFINYSESNKKGSMAVDKDGRRTELLTVVGEHTEAYILHTQDKQQQFYQPWFSSDYKAVDTGMTDMPHEGSITYVGEAVGIADAEFGPLSHAGRGTVTMTADFKDAKVEGSIQGQGPNNPFGDGIYIKGNILAEKWISNDVKNAAGQGEGFASGNFAGGNNGPTEMSGSYEFKASQNSPTNVGAFVGTAQK